MRLRAVLFLGLRNFWSGENGRRIGQLRGAIAGVALSLVPLVVVLEVANGMIEGITARYIEVGTFHLQVKSLTAESEKEFESVMASIRSVPGVTEAFPAYSGLGLAYSTSGRTGVAVRALPANLYATDSGFRHYLTMTAGTFDLTGPTSALLSVDVAKALQVKVGEPIRLLTAKNLPGGNFILRPNRLVVRGIFTTGYNELDSLAMFISDAKGREVFTDPGARFIGVKVIDPYGDLQPIVHRIEERLPRSWYLFTWYQMEKPMYKTFETTKNLLLFIMILIVLVASVNISSALVMLVIEKNHEIAILKSTGASPAGITRAFVATGFVIGAVGTAGGMGLGLLAAVNINAVIAGLQWLINAVVALWQLVLSPFVHESAIHVTLLSTSYYLDRIPIRLDWQDLGVIAFLSIFLSTVAAWFPARRAGAIRPIEVMRRY